MKNRKLFWEIIGIAFFSGMIGILYNVVSPDGIPFIYEKPKEVIAKFGEEATSGDAENKDEFIQIVTYAQVLELKDNPEFLIIDARSPEAFEEARIGEAINIYPYQDDEFEYHTQLTQIPFEKSILVYCDGGNCDSSHMVAEGLKAIGHKKVYLYKGGWEEWETKMSDQG